MMSEELNWCMRDKTPPYAKLQAKDGDTVITLYESGKVVFQGSDADLASDFWITTEKINSGSVNVKDTATKEKSKENNPTMNKKIYYSSSIGSDEVGTGDYFGPIVVTAAFVNKENIGFLEEIGVKDSKKITDSQIIEIVPKFIKKIEYESIILNNEEYNKYYSSNLNMNKIKAILHNKVLFKMKQKINNYEYIIVDQFAQPKTYFNYLKDVSNMVRDITFFTKGEDKHLAVACASLISRFIFLNEFNKLSDSIGIELHKGASDIVDETAKIIIQKFGINKLNEIAKLNFKNTEKIKETN